MIRAVLDTNILVSALLSPAGAPARVFDHVLNGRVVLCYDSSIIHEYKEVLNRPRFKFNPQAVDQVIDFILHSGHSIVPRRLEIDFTDEDDKVFFEVAKHVQGYLVTGNAKHYPQDAMVVSAVEFLAVIEGRSAT